jgi:hypothetical protein
MVDVGEGRIIWVTRQREKVTNQVSAFINIECHINSVTVCAYNSQSQSTMSNRHRHPRQQ